MKHGFLRLSPGVIVAMIIMTLTASGQSFQVAQHPDLGGMWNGAAAGINRTSEDNGNITSNVASRRCAPNQKGCNDQTNQTVYGDFTGRMDPNRPLYKPEFWDKVQDLDRNTNTVDPIFKCQPYGVPRMGGPTKIVQTKDEVIFLYAAAGAGTQPNDFRIIPTDGRGHDPVRSQDVSYYGDSVGHWEGDTLVIDSVGFNERFWMERQGAPHTDQLHLIERLTRIDSNNMKIEVTIDDPGAYTRTWTTGFFLRWTPDDETMEYICQANNRAAVMMVGVETGVDRSSPIIP